MSDIKAPTEELFKNLQKNFGEVFREKLKGMVNNILREKAIDKDKYKNFLKQIDNNINSIIDQYANYLVEQIQARLKGGYYTEDFLKNFMDKGLENLIDSCAQGAYQATYESISRWVEPTTKEEKDLKFEIVKYLSKNRPVSKIKTPIKRIVKKQLKSYLSDPKFGLAYFRLKNKYGGMSIQNKKYQEEIENKDKSIKELKGKIKNNEKTIEELNNKIKSITDERDNLKAKIRELEKTQKSNIEKDKQIEALNKKLDTLNNELAKTKEELNITNDELKKYKKLYNSYWREYRKTASMYNSFRKKVIHAVIAFILYFVFAFILYTILKIIMKRSYNVKYSDVLLVKPSFVKTIIKFFKDKNVSIARKLILFFVLVIYTIITFVFIYKVIKGLKAILKSKDIELMTAYQALEK